jgi:hypothetical protein
MEAFCFERGIIQIWCLTAKEKEFHGNTDATGSSACSEKARGMQMSTIHWAKA